MNTIVTDSPQGRVHINQATGQPARWVGSNTDPGTAAFYQERGWQTTKLGSDRTLTWDDLSSDEQRTYKRQYPVV